MKVVLSPRSLSDLRRIQVHISQDNAPAAVRAVDQITTIAGMLADHPYLGREYEGEVRRLSVPRLPYCIYYRVKEAPELVEVVTVFHTSRIPPTFS